MKKRFIAFSNISIHILFFLVIACLTVAASELAPVKYASSDYNRQTGLIYQGVSDTEHIYLNTEELSIQGKQKGTLDLVDYNNDGNADLFTTGFYINKEGQKTAVSELHQDLKIKTGTFSQLKHSASCWADFDNNGFMEPAIIGQDNDDKSYFEIYRNDEGVIRNAHSLPGLKYGSLECFDFNKDGWTDLVACGQDTGGNFYAGIYQNHKGILEQIQTLQEFAFCSININDFNQDGFMDFVIGGEDTNYQPYTYLYLNNGQTFTRTSLGLNQSVKLPAITSADYDNDGRPDIVLSGSAKQSKTLLLRNLGKGFQQVATDIIQVQDSTAQFMDFDQDQQLELFITGVYSDGIDERYLSQLLSFDFTAENNPPSAPSELNYENLDQQFLRLTWQKATDDHSDYLFYHVRAGTENNPNEFLSGFLFDEKGNAQLAEFKILKNPCLTGIESFLFQVQAVDSAYSISQWSKAHEISCGNAPKINPIQNKTIQPSEKVFPVQIDSQPVIPNRTIRKVINVSTIIEENKTTVEFQVKVNASNLLEKDVMVIQTLPKCLIERINELAIRSGKIKSNREFIVLEEDPVIMWTFNTITEPEHLKLEIQAVADENCSNQIKTEIVAKRYLARHFPLNPATAFLQILIPLLLFAILSILLRYTLKTTSHKKTHHIMLLIISLGFIVISILDTLSLLPATLDFLKKMLAWLSILLLMAHIDLATLLTGLPKEKAKISRFLFNAFLIAGFVFLSIKNVIFVAFESYGQERLFSDLLMLIIKYSGQFEIYLFFAGTILALTAILLGWLKFPVRSHSMAETITPAEPVAYRKHLIRKFLLITFLIMGFYTAIFHFLFDWFSIGIDSPFLLLLTLFSYKALTRPDIEEISIQRYLQMFTHKEKRWMALSFFPILIFMVEAYLSVFYWLTGRKNLYLKAVAMNLPNLKEILQNTFQPAWGIYLLQIAGLLAIMICGFGLWWRIFQRNQNFQKNSGKMVKPVPNLCFYLVVIGMISYLLDPVFNLVPLHQSRLSGVLLVLKGNLPDINLILHYTVIIAVVILFLVFHRTKLLKLVSYITTSVSVAVVTVFFALSYLVRIARHLQNLPVAPDNIATIIILANSFFLTILAVVYTVIIAFSLFAWFRLLFMQLREFLRANRFFHER